MDVRSILRYLQTVFDSVVNSAVLWLFALLSLNRKAEISHCVLIELMGGIGDYVLFTATLQGYRNAFPTNKTVFIARKELKPLVDQCPYIDYFIPVQYEFFRHGIIERFRIGKEIAKYQFDVCVNASYSSVHEHIERPVALWSKARRKIAFQCLDKTDQRDYSIYTDVFQQNQEWEFEIDRNNSLVRHLGAVGYDKKNTSIWGIDREDAVRTTKKLGIGREYYILFPGSFMPEKCWPIEKFIALNKKLSPLGLNVVICGSKQEMPKAKEIMNSAGNTIHDTTGKTSTLELAQVISLSKFVVSNDTSAVHIAGALNIPCFAILGGGHYGRFLPYPHKSSIVAITSKNYFDCFQCYWNCIYDSTKCIDDISVEEVLNNIYGVIRSG